MTVRSIGIFLIPLLGAGCATHTPQPTPPPPMVVAMLIPVKVVETRYDVRGYREPANPDVRHEAHAVYRRTRVPTMGTDELATVPRETFAPASYAPLPGDGELAAELASQRAMTEEIRAMHATMATTERQTQAQYAQLLRQSAEVIMVREQLEAERSGMSALPTDPGTATPSGAKAESNEVKW